MRICLKTTDSVPKNFGKSRKLFRDNNTPVIQSTTTLDADVFEPEKIVETYRKEFDDRLSSVVIKPPLHHFKDRTDQLCEEIIRTTSKAKEPDFSLKELNVVVKKLKKGKAYGPDRKPAEVYMNGGDHLMSLMVQVLNSIKHAHITPEL